MAETTTTRHSTVANRGRHFETVSLPMSPFSKVLVSSCGWVSDGYLIAMRSLASDSGLVDIAHRFYPLLSLRAAITGASDLSIAFFAGCFYSKPSDSAPTLVYCIIKVNTIWLLVSLQCIFLGGNMFLILRIYGQFTDEQQKLAESVGLSPAWVVGYARHKICGIRNFLEVQLHAVAF